MTAAEPKRSGLFDDDNIVSAKTSPKRKSLVLGLGKNISMELFLIPSGKFLMGSPESEGRQEALRQT